MTTVTIRQAKANFSKLIARVCKGEENTLTEAGKPMAKIVPFEAAPKHRERTARNWGSRQPIAQGRHDQ